MKFSPVRLAFSALASLAMMASSASAVTILQFGQTSPTDVVTATFAGGVTTLNTNSLAAPGSIAVKITNIGGTLLGTPIDAFETFTNVVSTGTATTVGGNIVDLYSGTIAITSGPGGTGGNFLTTTFTDATLSGATGGGSAALVGSRPPQNVLFTSNFAQIIPLIAGNPPENFSISFSNINPGLTITGTGANATIAPFTAQNTGTFATGTAVPEPASIAMVSMGLLTGLGCFMRRRHSIGA